MPWTRRSPRWRSRVDDSRYGDPIVPPADDQTLIAAAQAGDRRALDGLLRRHQDRIYAVCRRLAGNDADARDATQEALIAIVRGLPRFDGRAAFTTWAHRVATNACLDELRRRGRRPVPGFDPVLAESSGVVRDDSPGVASAAADRLDIDDALRQLPEEFRAPVVLRDQLGMDYAEIAAVLDIPPGTVRSRIARGRAALATTLQPPEPSRETPADDQTAGGNQNAPDRRPTPEP